MAWKLAISPASATNDSSAEPMPAPKIASNASISGSSDSPTPAAPVAIPEPSVSVNTATTISASIAHMIALGMSRCGFFDSSAANGTSSIAKKNQTANGNACAIPSHPNGRNRELPPSGSIFSARSQLKFGIAPIQKTQSMPRAMKVVAIVALKLASTPTMFIPTNTVKNATHQIGTGTSMPNAELMIVPT